MSPIFLREKRDGSFHMILNLKTLKQYVEYNHCKMETVCMDSYFSDEATVLHSIK